MAMTIQTPRQTGASPAPFTILIVEDEACDAEMILHAIEEADLHAFEGEIRLQVRATAEGALALLKEQPVDVVLTDMILPKMDGLDLVTKIQEVDSNLPVLVVTRKGGIASAVEAMRRGAYDYIVKPLDAADLGMRLHRAIRISEIIRRNSAFQRSVRRGFDGGFVGISSAFQGVMQKVHDAAQGRTTVLIIGETGTGKGLIARAIHEQTHEPESPYQVIDCTTVPEGMMESELFGHVRGAFTGAVADKPGLIELANGGTAFLDEIGDLPLHLQAKLLRVLEENEVRPVGGTRIKRVRTRFIAATNQELAEKVQHGTFRKDLYFRLNSCVIRVPPLRDRLDDIPPIARYWVRKFGTELRRPSCYLDPSAMAELVAYPWPGNVRELRNLLERAVMIGKRDAITGADIRSLLPPENQTLVPGYAGEWTGFISQPYRAARRKLMTAFTSTYLKAKLAAHDGNITRAAEESGITRQQFSVLLKRYQRDRD